MQKRLEWYEKRYGPYIEKRGLHNWKNLFRKPTLQELTILFMIILTCISAYAYSYDVKECKTTLSNLDNICLMKCKQIADIPEDYGQVTNFTTIQEVVIESAE